MDQRISVGVTGTTGFVGERFMACNASKFDLRSIDLRKQPVKETDLSGLDVIVHFAGLAHQLKPVPDELYYNINVELTRELITKAISDGLKHFIYISSTKVYGDDVAATLDETSPYAPTDAYGESKRKAEELVRSKSAEILVSIVRPPVVYGPKVKGNILKLMHLAMKKTPLPFGNIRNQRSMVYVDNLVALINSVIEKKAAGIFIAGDLTPVSTTQLVSTIRQKMHGRANIFNLPSIVKELIRLLKPGMHKRLFGSYVIDNTATNKMLGFTPPVTTDNGIGQMVEWFKQQQNIQ